MKIGIISESPLLTTGFGVACDQFARQLVTHGWKVSCLGIGFSGVVNALEIPYRIWLTGRHTSDFFADMFVFLANECPDIILLLGDISYVKLWLDYLLEKSLMKNPIVAHVVSDGLPVSKQFIKSLRRLTGIMVGTNALANHLQTVHGLSVHVVQQGVDLTVFQPMCANKKKLIRQALGLGDIFLVGVFGRNDGRKQHPRVLHALQLLRDQHNQNNIRVYMHCQKIDDPNLQGWNLDEIVQQLFLEDIVIFPNHFNQLQGIPRIPQMPREPEQQLLKFDSLSYVERLAICDMVVNSAFAGGYEFTTLEAQACGVPIAITNDYGNMAEVAGPGAALMEGSVGYWSNGAKQYFVDPSTIAKFIILLQNDILYREGLINAGRKNAGCYSWDIAGQYMHTALLSILETQQL